MIRVNAHSAIPRATRRAIGTVLAIALALPTITPETRAQDASFGCKVLLCAAASAPGWSGIPYCVPVMRQLFTQLARRGAWPVCSEAQAGSVGYEPYHPCPAGLTPLAADGADGGQEASTCADLTRPQQVCEAGETGVCRTTYPTVARELRSEPNFVDLSTPDGNQRFYFSLRGY